MADASLEFYASGPDLARKVLDALREAGREVDPLDPDDLAGLDEFHGLGRASTLALAELTGIEEGTRVLDAGAGIGGPARTLARHFGASVTTLDPTHRFCELNEDLTRRSGLSGQVEVVEGDGRAMPFGDAEFELAWTQALWQSVEDKHALARELHRVLEPGGRLAIFEVVTGPAGGELDYPLPWADGPEESFVVAPGELRELLGSAGFEAEQWLEGMDAIGRIGDMAGSSHPGLASGAEGVTLALVMPNFEERMAGLARNVEAQRIAVLMAVLNRR